MFLRQFNSRINSSLNEKRHHLAIATMHFVYNECNDLAHPCTKNSTISGSIIGKICVDITIMVPTSPKATPEI